MLVVAGASPARAGRHVVERGETLEHVAQIYGCSVEAVLRANHLDNTLVRAGTVVVIPSCTVRSRARTRERPARSATAPHDATDSQDASDATASSSEDDRARRALDVIDGTTVVRAAASTASRTSGSTIEREASSLEREVGSVDHDGSSESIGQPWNGSLRNGEVMPRGEGYKLRRPQRAFGATHVVEHLRHVIAEVRALYPRVHTLAIGDLSAEHGGKLADHVSHQSGLDVDLGFYFQKVPADYPDKFVMASSAIDLEATWALVTAFARTTPLDTGVQVILLDHDVQGQLYRWARAHGTPDDQLAEILQYPRSKDTLVGIVRHWPHHADHLHVRFKP